VNAKIPGPHGQNNCFVDLIADIPHHRNCNVMDICLPSADIGKANELESEAVFSGLRIEFAEIAFDQAAEQSKYRCLG